MIIRLYSITGRTEGIENDIRALITDIKSALARRGIDENRVRLTIIKVRGDVVDEVLKYLDQPDNKIPGQYRSLIVRMRQDGVSTFPALVINDKKVAEGDGLTLDVAKQALFNELRSEFNIEIPELAPPPQPQPQPQPPPQPQLQPQPQIPPAPQVQLPPPPPPPPQVPAELQVPTQATPSAVKPLLPQPAEQPQPQPTQTVVQPQPTVTMPQPQPPAITIPPLIQPMGFRVVYGRPDNCMDCMYYGPSKRYCYLYALRVSDPAKPPCKVR